MNPLFLSRFFFLYPLFYLPSFAQQYKSIHQEQAEHYNKFSHYTEQQFDSLNGNNKQTKSINPSQSVAPSVCTLNKIVFGWHPYWVGTVYNNYQWSLLSDLSYFSYDVDANTGNATSTHGWSTATVVDIAKQNGVRVNLCVTLFSGHATFFGSSTSQQTLITNLINLIQSRGANGVNIDFEGLPSSQKTAFTNFMVNLSNQMHAAIPGSQVSMALYSVDWSGVFDMPTLNQYVDLFIIMGYDYYYGGSTTAGPNDPLYHFGTTYNYTLSKSVTYYLSKGTSLSKLVLGLPWYSREYTTTSNAVPSPVLNPPNSITRTFKTVKDNTSGNFTNANKYWNSDSYTPYYMFQSAGNWKQCFIDDAYSMERRFDLVNQRGIGGIGIWALGYDDGYTDYWDAIRNKLTNCAVVNCSDSIFDMGGPNKNYYDSENYIYTISPNGASAITLSFSSFDVEANFDTLWLYNGTSLTSPLIGAYTGTNSPGTVTSTVGSLTVRFKSDVSTNRPGWKAIWTCTIDNTPPTTQVSVPGNWATGNFTATFTDADNSGGSGLEKSYYSVQDFNGTEWRGNNSRGFFHDAFDSTVHPEWTMITGTWGINNSVLLQSDDVPSNTNIYVSLTQNLSNRHIYHWKGKIAGSGTNRRAGFHFFSDDGSLPNRGNSYFVWIRADQSQLQFYKVINDTFYLKNTVSITATPGILYDYKVMYDRITGKMIVYQNDVFIGSWTDPIPYSNGSYISFRSGNATWSIDDFQVFRSRQTTSETILTGQGTGNDIRYQNSSPTQPSGRIRSIVNDNVGNISSITQKTVNVDWTPPSASLVNDGTAGDIDTTYTNTSLTANWTNSADTHSAVISYWYAIGTTAGATNIVGWTTAGTNTSITHSGLSLTYNQTYYFSIKSENGAGLFSSASGESSDGQYLAVPAASPVAAFSNSSTALCSGDSVMFSNSSSNATTYNWTFQGGMPSVSSIANPSVVYTTGGSYQIQLTATGPGGADTLVQTITVSVSQPPSASFSTPTTTVYVPNTTVNFTSTSSNAASYNWSFGDGGISTLANPSHTYQDTGKYDVLLIVTNSPCANDSSFIAGYITVIDTTVPPPPVPLAAFSYSGTTLCAGDSVQFTNSSINSVSYEWVFQSAYPASSIAFNPSVTYSTNGTYQVTLIAHGNNGTDTLIQNITVNVSPFPSASFSVSSTVVYVPNTTVTFTNGSSNATSYIWYFGDGNSDSVPNPTHKYQDTGKYAVTLIAINGVCPNDTLYIQGYITVIDTTPPPPSSPVASFSNSGTTICAGDSIQFNNSSVNTTSYQWLFQGATPGSSSNVNPSVTYIASGSFQVQLIATGPGGSDTSVQILSVSVNQAPVAGFTASDTILYLPNAFATFTNNSQNASGYLWNFGDGATSVAQNPWYNYSDTGYFTVTLVAANNFCPADTLVLSGYIHVTMPPVVGFHPLNSSDNLYIYPNPFDNYLIIMLPEEVFNNTNATVKLTDITGKCVYSNSSVLLQKCRNTIMLKDIHLADGMYFFDVNDGASKHSTILLKK